jgi:hypothetical protein
MSAVTASRPAEPRTLGRITWLHLAPGIASLLGYVVLARVVTANGLPNLMGLMLAALLVEAPVLWWLMARLVRREGGAVRWRDLFPWDERVSLGWYVTAGLAGLLWGMAMIGVVAPAIGAAVVEPFFGWLPEWFVMTMDPDAIFAQPRGVLVSLWALSIAMALVAGSSQELYFRGFLLPRMADLGWAAPFLNAALFAVFHMIAPWNWIPFFLGTLPWSLLMWWKKSIRLTLFVHVGMLLFQSLMMGLVVFGLIAMPGGG